MGATTGLPNLRYLGLGRNQLTGSIPASFGDLPCHVTHASGVGHDDPSPRGQVACLIWLQDNNFTGAIPRALCNRTYSESRMLYNNDILNITPFLDQKNLDFTCVFLRAPMVLGANTSRIQFVFLRSPISFICLGLDRYNEIYVSGNELACPRPCVDVVGTCTCTYTCTCTPSKPSKAHWYLHIHIHMHPVKAFKGPLAHVSAPCYGSA